MKAGLWPDVTPSPRQRSLSTTAWRRLVLAHVVVRLVQRGPGMGGAAGGWVQGGLERWCVVVQVTVQAGGLGG